MTRIENYVAFVGEHCETNATGNLLKHAGLEFSEPMLFGLGEGLSFGVLVFRNMPAPFIGGRPRPEELTRALARNLGIKVAYRQTRSRKKAWDNVAGFVDAGQPVAAKIDMYYLDYFTSGMHFAGHYVAVYGYDDHDVYVVDTRQQGGTMTTGRHTFEKGRLWKGPMSSNALTWTVKVPAGDIDLSTAIRSAIVANAASFLDPPISNFGAKGIVKASKLVPTWLDTVNNAPAELARIGMLMERGGTGGALFRTMYRDFLTEAAEHLGSPVIEAARDRFAEAVPLWTEVAGHLGAAGEDGRRRLEAAAELLLRLADLEKAAFTDLATL